MTPACRWLRVPRLIGKPAVGQVRDLRKDSSAAENSAAKLGTAELEVRLDQCASGIAARRDSRFDERGRVALARSRWGLASAG